MNITEATEIAAAEFKRNGNLTPSHCDVRCCINNLLDGTKYAIKGYSQNRAWQSVRKILGTPVKLSESPYAPIQL